MCKLVKYYATEFSFTSHVLSFFRLFLVTARKMKGLLSLEQPLPDKRFFFLLLLMIICGTSLFVCYLASLPIKLANVINTQEEFHGHRSSGALIESRFAFEFKH